MEPTKELAEAPLDATHLPESLERREALVTMGKYSAFTAPTVAVLLVAGKDEAFGGSAVGGTTPGGGKKPKKPKKPKMPK